MRCQAIPGLGFVCGSRESRKRCSTPGCSNWSTALCDFPVTRKGKAGTCDAHLCDRCRVRQPGEDKDFCPPHANASAPSPTDPNNPQRGDHRVHIATGRDLYVVSVDDWDGEKHVTFSTNRPDARGRCGGVRQSVPLSKWIEKTRAP